MSDKETGASSNAPLKPRRRRSSGRSNGRSPQETEKEQKARQDAPPPPSPSNNKNKTRPARRGPRRQSSNSRLNASSKLNYAEYWEADDVEDGLRSGVLFRSTLRCSASDRSQAFATLPGLPHDVFIPGLKAQNRSVEGDEVALRILPLPQWHLQDTSKAKVASTPTSNAVPFGSPIAFEELPSIHSVGEEENDLIMSPAMVPSLSGGELPIALEAEDGEDEQNGVEALTQELQCSALLEPSTPSAPADMPWVPMGPPGSNTTPLKVISNLLCDEYKGWRATAEVVRVLTPSPRRQRIVGVLRIFGGTLTLVPSDPRLPKAIVDRSSLPKRERGVLTKEAGASEPSGRTLVVASMEEWPAGELAPKVIVRESLGRSGDLQVEVAALLAQEGVHDDDQFTPDVLGCLPASPWVPTPEDIASRRDFRSQRVFSIDPPTARDLDDALSVTWLENGTLEIGVHIADVSHFVRPNTPLDFEARQRSTSTHLMDRVIPMLPRLLCEELCSLNPGVDRFALSIVWNMTRQGAIKSTWIGRSVIRSCAKLAYPHAQAVIDAGGIVGPPAGVIIHGDHGWEQIRRDIEVLHEVASSLRRKRFEIDGALRLDNVRLCFTLDENDGVPIDYGVYEQREANRLVEEFMLAANMTAARLIADAFPEQALLRCHHPPNQRKMEDITRTIAQLAPDAPMLDASSAGALQASLRAMREAVDPGVADIITLLCTKPMQIARYFCTGDTPERDEWRHYALAVGHYTHFTSPIRRYPDIVVHRLVTAALAGSQTCMKDPSEGPPSSEFVTETSSHANGRKFATKAVQDGAVRLYLAAYLLRKPGVYRGIVMGVGGSRFFDIYIPELGVDVRCHTDRILRGGARAVQADWDAPHRRLRLEPKASVSASMLEPDYTEVENFDKVRNVLGLLPAAWPIEVTPLSRVTVVLGGARRKSSGSPAGMCAKLWVESPAVSV